MTGSKHIPAQRRGFTLIEILIVVIILGVLASIIIAQVVVAGKDTRESALKENLRIVRTQLIMYKQLHAFPAGYDGSGTLVSAETFRTQMTQYTDMAGNCSATADTTHNLRPIIASFPRNPLNDRYDVRIATGAFGCDETTGWIYRPDTEEFVPNSAEYGPGGLNW